MNAEAKTLADELRTIARCIYIAVEKTVADDIAGKAVDAGRQALNQKDKRDE